MGTSTRGATPRTQSGTAGSTDTSGTIDVRSARVVVLSGGRSSEREVSLKTSAAIARALSDSSDGRGPARVTSIEILPDGAWRTPEGTSGALEALAALEPGTIVFLGLHGGAGEDGTLQGLLESAGFAHTGSGVAASALCMCKSWTRDVLARAGLAVAPGRTVDAHEWRTARAEVLRDVASLGASGLAVKPDRGGSSVSTFLVSSASEAADAIERVLATGDRAVVEARIVGAEATCGVLGSGADDLRVLTPVEIVPKDGRFFDYEEKYSSSGASEHCPPRTLTPETVAAIRRDAARAYLVAGCSGYARIDFMIPRVAPRDSDARASALHASGMPASAVPEGRPVVLEINTLPGMTDRSLLPLAAAEAGISFRDLCLEILRRARRSSS